MAPQEDIKISMTSFSSFCIADPMSQASKAREIRKRYEAPYTPSSDFWSRWREGIEGIHRRDGVRDDLQAIGDQAKDNRQEQYTSAASGYRKFWGRKSIEIVGAVKPAIWQHGRLQVKVNPEWVMRINGELTVVKLHLTDRLTLNQRLSNPLLHLLEAHHGSTEREVALLDVHRGKLWRPTASSRQLQDALRMQAAAFVVGWDAAGAQARSA